MTDLAIWTHVTAAVCTLLIMLCAPLAVVSIRLEKKMAAEARAPAVELQPSRRARKMRDKFIANNVRLTTFGDKRRRTSVVADIMLPETGPICLPNEHVEPVREMGTGF